MRILGGDIKLVLVDEPSSAMDPAAERALFANLRDLRSGKTMIFITHKFGYLTQFADVILCVCEVFQRRVLPADS
jgi:ABC-type bacteriocin/lantibiotic exporter with double-glycine peptidase domain